MNLKLRIFLFSLCILYQGLAQREASNWYFGENAGVQFNPDGSVTPLTDGQLNTLEGCASISDRFGNLLFYTDGVTVWDRTHQIMPGGNGLLGNFSSTQSAIIVPQPGSRRFYYIFTVSTVVAAEQGTQPDFELLQGINFYTVDIEAGANGELIYQGNLPDDGSNPEDNEPLLIPNSEKITAVRSADCNSIWVITHFRDSFYAYEVSETGVNREAIISEVGVEVPFPVDNGNSLGYLKASPDGSRLAIAHLTLSTVPNQNTPGVFALYDFDIENGTVSNEQILDTDNGFPYGLEFSPNNDLLYVSGESTIFQFDVTTTDINASRFTITADFGGKALQLGPNGRIYHATGSVLSAIENPDVVGQGANFVVDAVPLAGRFAQFGLPPFIQSLFNEVINITGMTNPDGSTLDDVGICEGEDFEFRVEDPIEGATYTWFFDNGTQEVALHGNEVFCLIENATADNAGLYRVEIDLMDGECPTEGFGFLTVIDLPENIAEVIVQCDFDNDPTDGFTLFNLEQAIENLTQGLPDLTVLFFEDEENNTPISNLIGYLGQNGQTIFVRIEGGFGCFVDGTLELVVESTSGDIPNNLNAFFSCDLDPTDNILEASFDLETIREENFPDNLAVTFFDSVENAVLELSPLSGTDFISSDTTIFVRVENANGCQGIEQFQLIVDPVPDIEFADEVPICLDLVPQTITGPSGFDIYNWYQITTEGEVLIGTGPSVEIFEVGEYRLEVGFEYSDLEVVRTCFNTTTFQTFPSNIATIVDIEINDISDNNNIVVFVEGEGDYEFALNPNGPFQSFNFFTNLPAGFVTVFVRDRNGCGTVEQIVSIIGFPRFFTPNDDDFNDFWQVSGVSDQFQSNAVITIFDRFGKVVAIIDPDSRGWDGNYNGRPMPSSGYWFSVVLEDGRNFTGHFALKR